MTRLENAGAPTRVAAAVLALAALASLFAAVLILVALAGLGQLSADADLTRAPAWLWYYRADPDVAKWTKYGAMAGGAAVAVLLIAAVVNRPGRPLHGAARWACEREIAGEGLRAKQGIVLGRQGGRYLVFGGSEHVMLYAPTRSGKGVGVVIPNLLNWPDSIVVLDVKQENYQATAGFRAEHGQAVYLFDPLNADGRTNCYNPLAHVDRSDPVATLDELQKLAVMLFPTGAEIKDPFWSESARTGFIGVGAYVAETPALPFTIGEIYRNLTQGDARQRFPELIRERAAAKAPLSAGCVSALSDFCGASENTFASIRSTITSRMNLWLNPRVDAATSRSDFDLRELRARRMSIYLGVSPDNLDRVAPLYNLIFQQLVDLNTRELPSERHKRQVLVLLDEFARLGHSAVLAKAFSYVAGYGLRLLPVLQSPSQLRSNYGAEVAEEIMTNCGVELVFTPKELRTAQDLSERLGYSTVKSRSKSRPAGLADGKRSVSESDQKRALMMPQELLQMDRDGLIVLRGGIPPIRGKKVAYYRERDFKRRLRPAPTAPLAKGVEPAASDEASAPTDTMGAIVVHLAEIRGDIAEIRTQLRERPMTVAEAAGEVALSYAAIQANLADLDDLPPEGSTEDEAFEWMNRHLNNVLIEPEVAA